VVNATFRALYPRQRDPVTTVHEAEWAPRPVWEDAKNLAPTGIRSPDRPALSASKNWTYIEIYQQISHIMSTSQVVSRVESIM